MGKKLYTIFAKKSNESFGDFYSALGSSEKEARTFFKKRMPNTKILEIHPSRKTRTK